MSTTCAQLWPSSMGSCLDRSRVCSSKSRAMSHVLNPLHFTEERTQVVQKWPLWPMKGWH